MTLAPHCADCGTEAALAYGPDVDPRDPEIADARVWACPVCPRAWSYGEGAPAGPETRTARTMVAAQMVRWAAANAPANERALAADRIAGFLAAQLGLTREAGAIDRLDLEQCRQAWRVLRAATYADVRAWAQNPPRRKARAA